MSAVQSAANPGFDNPHTPIPCRDDDVFAVAGKIWGIDPKIERVCWDKPGACGERVDMREWKVEMKISAPPG